MKIQLLKLCVLCALCGSMIFLVCGASPVENDASIYDQVLLLAHQNLDLQKQVTALSLRVSDLENFAAKEGKNVYLAVTNLDQRLKAVEMSSHTRAETQTNQFGFIPDTK